MYGDSGLLHLIAERAGMISRGKAWKTEEAVLQALTRQPGELIPCTTLGPTGNRRVRIFYLPEHFPVDRLARKDF